MTIEDMDLSMRAYNCLKRAGIHTVAELVQKNQEEMMKVRNLGKKSLEEVEQKLAALGAGICIAARKEADRALAEAFGFGSMDLEHLEGEIGNFDLIVNTIPARILSDAALCCAQPDTLLLELASAPGGFDRALAQNIGLHVVTAPGLPGRCLPRSAADLLRRTVYEAIREQEE